MYCDYDALEDNATNLNRLFNSVVKSMNGIEDSIKNITSTNNWNAETRDYFAGLCSALYEDFNIVNNKFTNIKQYLDSTVDNYRSFDKSISFGGRSGGGR